MQRRRDPRAARARGASGGLKGSLKQRAAPEAAALPAGLRHVSDTAAGIRRVRRGNGFAYRHDTAGWLRDAQEIARIRKLAIPPAYTAVWICPHADGHLQATGRDARGRKQYRYHDAFRQLRDETKFDRLAAFGRALPRLRARVKADLAAGMKGPPTRERVLAAIVRLLDTTYLRVGNTEYARENGSFGLTTLRSRHAKVQADRLMLSFRGKSGVQHDVTVDDPRVARIVRSCQQLPGQDLFRYVDADGEPVTIGSADVNDYLAASAPAQSERFTAKDFRTWHGSVQALDLVRLAHLDTDGRSSAVAIVREVAQRLGNTVAVCRKAYIHPTVLAMAAELERAGREGALWLGLSQPVRTCRGLTALECRLLAVLATGQGKRRRA